MGDTESAGLIPLAAGQNAGGAVTFSLLREATSQSAGLIMAFVPKSLAAAHEGFSFALPKEALLGVTPEAPVRVSGLDGQPLPSWLRFDQVKRSFVASAVPPEGLPLRVQVGAGDRLSIINLVEVDR